MLTARIEDTDKIVGLELGADDYIGVGILAAQVRCPGAGIRRGLELIPGGAIGR